MDDRLLTALAAEIERQDAALADARHALDALDEQALEVPRALLEELDGLTTARPPTPYATPVGALRA